ncbi:MAG: glycosyltransferase family 1 protein [Anaerolineae bacterium]|nr:glycosyltransferase family 1 protein [Anaerolineae bacterium]
MANHYLFEALTHFDVAEAQRVFGDEVDLRPPDPAIELAPVKRVALFAEAFLPKVDGVSKTAYLTLHYLKQTGRDVIVFAPDIAPHSIGDTQVIPLPSLGLPQAPETRIAIPHPTINQYLDDFKPDLIHLFSPALMSVSGMTAGRQRQIPVIANYQTDLPGYTNAYGLPIFTQITRDWLRYIHNGCHLTLAPSRWTLNELQQWGFRRLRRWGRGVHSGRFNPAHRSDEWRARLLNGRPQDSLLCIYVGRLATEKRVDLLLETARTPGIALTIIGDGAMRSELEGLFAGTGTHFTGYLYGDELAHAFASADVFMFTGGHETFGQVVQEAMASGLAPISINQGGVTDLVHDGVNGFICPPDPHAFAQAARTLLENEALRRAMSAESRRMAEARPWEVLMGELEGHYREAHTMNARFKSRYRQPSNRPIWFGWGR